MRKVRDDQQREDAIKETGTIRYATGDKPISTQPGRGKADDKELWIGTNVPERVGVHGLIRLLWRGIASTFVPVWDKNIYCRLQRSN
jgi:hypothetical protein